MSYYKLSLFLLFEAVLYRYAFIGAMVFLEYCSRLPLVKRILDFCTSFSFFVWTLPIACGLPINQQGTPGT